MGADYGAGFFSWIGPHPPDKKCANKYLTPDWQVWVGVCGVVLGIVFCCGRPDTLADGLIGSIFSCKTGPSPFLLAFESRVRASY